MADDAPLRKDEVREGETALPRRRSKDRGWRAVTVVLVFFFVFFFFFRETGGIFAGSAFLAGWSLHSLVVR